MFGLPMNVVVGAGILVVVTLMLMTVIARMYRKAGPHEALIVYGLGGTNVYTGKGHDYFSHGADLQGSLAGADVLRCRSPAESLHQARRRGHRRSRGANQGEE